MTAGKLALWEAKGTSGEARACFGTTRLTHLRHQRAIFAVMHSDVFAQGRANVRPLREDPP
jgi:hypothetical protein